MKDLYRREGDKGGEEGDNFLSPPLPPFASHPPLFTAHSPIHLHFVFQI